MRSGPPPDARLLGAVPGRPNRVVKNAPFSADAVTETTQTLADGNRIRQSAKAKLYRDADGRERNEQSLGGLGILLPNASLPTVIYINDPVAGVDYALNSRDKTASRFSRDRGPSRGPQPGESPKTGQDASHANAPDGGRPGGGRWGRGGRSGPPMRDAVKTESLGRQTMEGVQADGTRTTQTIPAGSDMGNELPIQIVSETWYSPDLQMVVYSRHVDPRAGETVYRLTNISRSDPPQTLFQPPPEYRVVSGQGAGRGQWNPR